jgi:hypothetical protein
MMEFGPHGCPLEERKRNMHRCAGGAPDIDSTWVIPKPVSRLVLVIVLASDKNSHGLGYVKERGEGRARASEGGRAREWVRE